LKAAVIDLGFNSVKMVCYHVDRGRFLPYRQDAFRARLGEGLDEAGSLGAAQMQRTMRCLKVLTDIAALESVERVVPIATSAVREASNGPQFMKSVLDETRLAFRVLSGGDEALYSFAGAMSSAAHPDVVFFDLGGGSLEIVRASDFRVQDVLSLPLGVLRLSFQYGDGTGTFTRRQARLMKRKVASALPSARDLRVTSRTRLVGVGGTVRAIARRDQEGGVYPFTKVQSYSVSYSAVSSMSKSFLRMSRRELGSEREIGNRADTIAAGALVIRMLMKSLGADELTVSARGVREGALSMYLADPKSFHRGVVSTKMVERVVREEATESKRLSNGYPLALERAGLVDRREAALLAEALRLVAGVPPSVNLRSLFYSILEEESALSKHDQLMLAAVTVTARNDRIAELMVNQYSELLGRRDREEVKRLAAFYSFVETLNRTGAELRASRQGRELVLRIAEGKSRLPVSLLSHRAEAVSDVLGLGLRITFASEGGILLAEGKGKP